ncbi:MAG: GAF domain-containing SpoIIE family protein phosphatase [bacterium]
MSPDHAPDFGGIAERLAELGHLAHETADNLAQGHIRPEELQLLLDVSREALRGATVLDLLREAERKRQENETFLHIGLKLSGKLNLDELLRTIIESLRQVVDYDAAGIFLINREKNRVDAEFLVGYETSDRQRLQKKFNEGVRVGEGIVGWVVQNGASVVVPDVHSDSRYISARDATHSEIAVPIVSGGDILGCLNLESNELGRYGEQDLEPLHTFASHVAVALERERFHREMIVKKRLEEELSIARRIQLSFLPTTMPQFEPYDLGGLNFPTLEVGGDYYDFIPITQTDLGVAIGDVAGKGVAAAILMASFRASLRLESRSNYAISTILQKVNQFLYESNPPEEFVTGFYGVIDRRHHVLTYSNAGHNPPFILRDGREIPLEVGGLLLGSFLEAQYAEARVELRSGDVLIFYTDGVTEARNDEGEEFGVRRLLDLVRSYRDLSAMDMVRRISREVQRFESENFPQDDLTLSVVKFR